MTRVLLLICALASSCSHVVQIKMADDSPADISVDGVALGKAPVNYSEGLAGKNSSYKVEARLGDGRVVNQDVKRSEMSMGAVGAGAGAGAGACVAFSAAGAVASFIIPFGGLIGCLGCAALIGGPAGGFLLAGQSTDVVTIDPTGKAPVAELPLRDPSVRQLALRGNRSGTPRESPPAEAISGAAGLGGD
jgi:hypothetical protein